jgi:hypothetical protein
VIIHNIQWEAKKWKHGMRRARKRVFVLDLDKAGCIVKKLRVEDAPAMILMRMQPCWSCMHATIKDGLKSGPLGALSADSRTDPVV